MALNNLLIFITCAIIAVAYCEDCVYSLKHRNEEFLFDLTSFKNLQSVNFTKDKDLHTINITLCNKSEPRSTCDGIKSKVCLIRKKTNQIDIGSTIKEMKLDGKNQLVITLEGNKLCEKNKRHITDLTFICRKSIAENKIVYNSSDNCKHVIEVFSVAACPVDDLDVRKSCTILIPHSNYKFNLSPLRRYLTNYLVENQNRRFEVNICGRLMDNNKCGGNITTICDVTDENYPKVYAVYNKNDQLLFDDESRSLKLIQHKGATLKQRGRRIEIVFKCNESITPEKTKPEFLSEDNYLVRKKSSNVAHFEIATSIVCIPRITSCEIFKDNAHVNLKPLHKRVGNWLVFNDISGGKFYLNVCDYLNQYGEEIPESCSVNRKTSACYVDRYGIGISIGSSQIGPHFVGNSLLLNYTDGANCKNSLKWSTIIYFTCSDKSKLVHVSTNFSSCTYIFHWESSEACESLFERKSNCMVTHPRYSNTVYNLNDLKDQDFEVNDENVKFRFSICSPLQTPCNGSIDSAACLSYNGTETNIGLFTEEIVFDNGKIYMSMQGEKCDDSGPNSYTIIRFVCDYSNSKRIKIKQLDVQECFYEIFIFTKNACTQNPTINCTVYDQLGNIYNLSELTKLNSNYEITINPKQKIILNVCHSVINNDIIGTNCQLNSGVCLVDKNYSSPSSWFKNLGDVDANSSPHKVGNTIILEMKNGFYNRHNVSSVIEFVCQIQSNNGYPVFVNEINHTFTFKWHTPLACPVYKLHKKREILEDKHGDENNHGYHNNTVEIHPPMETLTELGCRVSSFDLRPLKGNYIINNETNTKYYISICMPGKCNIEGIIEFNGKNYSIGYQQTLNIDKGGNVYVHFKNGDFCQEKSKMGMKLRYSTKILWICSSIERNPIVQEIKKCALEFLWETSYVCNKIMLEFNECKREAFIIGYSEDIKNSKSINMNNILKNVQFFDNSTQILFDVNFCNASVYLNNYLSFLSLVNLQYNVNKNQLNANFKNIDHIGFSSMKIKIACSRTIENLSVPKVELTDGEVKINMYSKDLCCMDNAYKNEEMCRNVPLMNTSTTIISFSNNEETTLSTHFQNYDNAPNETDSEDSVVLTKENIEESDLHNENNNAILQYYGTTVLVDIFADQPFVKKEESGFLFYLGVILMVFLLMSLIWLYRWKLLKEIRKLSYILISARRRRESYNRSSNLMEFN